MKSIWKKAQDWWEETDLDGIWKNFSVVWDELVNWAGNMKRTNLPRFKHGNWFGNADHDSYFHLFVNLISESVRDLRRTISYIVVAYLVVKLYDLVAWLLGLIPL